MPCLVDDPGKPALSLGEEGEMGQGDMETCGGDRWEEWRERSVWYGCIAWEKNK